MWDEKQSEMLNRRMLLNTAKSSLGQRTLLRRLNAFCTQEKQVLTGEERRFKPLLFETIQHNPFLLPLLRCMNIIGISAARQGDTRFSFHSAAL